jgi:hypothetical protein
VKDVDDQDESTHKNTGEAEEEAQDIDLVFDDNLDLDVDNIEIEKDDHIFMAILHLVNPYHFICTSSMMCRCLAEASAKNSLVTCSMLIMLNTLDINLLVDYVASTCLHRPSSRFWSHLTYIAIEPMTSATLEEEGREWGY